MPDLDGDEVGLALVSDGLGKQGLATPWWSVEENTLRWGHPKLKELLWKLNRILGGGEGGGVREFPISSNKHEVIISAER